ncbi:hypothetical protein CK203_045928 [Vitis vinifera]|uniref:Retrovirus-related Pol polyprotein from transposon RE2 n=1 Tax=Vitis vinifera TaxID=29760 RepID=A0A438I4X1_VITVI|nr:hypothetical protein CK203_045928 [Vitis vinifera]
MQQSKDYDDALALVDAPIGETFLIIHILDGLSSEFKEIVVVVRACETSIIFKELHDKLLAHAATIAILIQRFSRPPLNYQPPSFSSQLRAHFVAQSNGSNTGWLMDSGASHHVTSDLQNMSLHSEHDDSDDIVIDLRTGAPLVIGRNRDGVYE